MPVDKEASIPLSKVTAYIGFLLFRDLAAFITYVHIVQQNRYHPTPLNIPLKKLWGEQTVMSNSWCSSPFWVKTEFRVLAAAVTSHTVLRRGGADRFRALACLIACHLRFALMLVFGISSYTYLRFCVSYCTNYIYAWEWWTVLSLVTARSKA